MSVLELLSGALTSILSLYLALTNSLASTIERHLPEPNSSEISVEVTSTSTSENAPSSELEALSRLYAGAGTISRLLKESESFQHAASLVNALPETHEELNPLTLASDVETALVNIFCEYTTPRYTRTTTGSGFFITDTGVILTNAHVAQFLLLESVPEAQGTTECTIRSGNPAVPQYRAELLFISPSWIFENAELLSQEHPMGTGEYDYALLYITSPLGENELPPSFPSLPLYTDYLSRNYAGGEVVTAGYPAEKLIREGKNATLTPESATTHIGELYTFHSNYADIFSVESSPVGEQGVSGGPVVKYPEGTIGLIVTKGDMDTDGEKSLRALSLSYIDRTIQEETGFSLRDNAQGDLPFRGKVFKEVLAPFLTKLLVDHL